MEGLPAGCGAASADNAVEAHAPAHHLQQALCSARPAYRQGRRLTAVKVYTVCDESPHLLVYGVPTLGLARELRALLAAHGELRRVAAAPPPRTHSPEPFTETFHAHYANVRSARIAKRKLDTYNFYGGSLHVCYAPELETVDETRKKLQQRIKDVHQQIARVERDTLAAAKTDKPNTIDDNSQTIPEVSKAIRKRKIPITNTIIVEKQYEPCFVDENKIVFYERLNIASGGERGVNADESSKVLSVHGTELTLFEKTAEPTTTTTSTTKAVIGDVCESEPDVEATLNYDRFGSEVVRQVPDKSVNRIKFNVNKK